ncbi:MAG: hypothetical protein GXP33_10690 [Spirochaetes bacterium]|nr:hypothetical protein [Spirochaetota bacterium]
MTGTVKLPLKEIEQMEHPLELFDRSKQYDPDLLADNLYPPLPFSGNMLIWGYRIISAAKENGLTELACKEITGKGPLQNLKTALKLENRRGKYSWEEKAKILEYLKNNNIGEKAVGLTAYIEEGSDTSWVKNAAIFRELSQPLREMIETGHIDFKTAALVRKFDDDIFLYIEKGKKLSFSQKRLLLTYFSEAVRRDKIDNSRTAELLKNILSSENPLKTVRELRFPKLSRMEKKYNALHSRYLLKSGIRITPPAYFEGDSFSVQFTFNSSKNLSEKIRKIQLIQEHIDEFLSFLR